LTEKEGTSGKVGKGEKGQGWTWEGLESRGGDLGDRENSPPQIFWEEGTELLLSPIFRK